VSSTVGIVAFVASIVLAIVIHEAGHLLTAKRTGMRADRFFVGFGPTLYSTRRGETEYGIKALLLGGYVRIVGMDPSDERQPPVTGVLPTLGAAGDEQRWWTALSRELDQRGASREQASHLLDATRSLASSTGELEVEFATRDARLRDAFERAVPLVLGPSTSVGDLAHRLLRGDEERFFIERRPWQRAVVLVAGPASHLVIAFALLFTVLLAWPQPTGELTSVVAAVQQGSPAELAGLAVGDRLVAVDDVVSSDFLVLRDALRARPEQPSVLRIERGEESLELAIVPAEVIDAADGSRVGLIGIATQPRTVRLGLWEASVAALVGPPGIGSPGGVLPMIGASAQGLVRIVSPSGLTDLVAQATGREERAVDGAISLVGAASLAGQVGAREGGLPVVLTLLAAINVFFFLFNMLPLPPFDGGHLAVVVIESSVNGVRRLRGRDASFRVRPEALATVAIPVIAVLVLLLVTTLWLDITDPIRL
jgi:regulator of sigma E protease